MSYDPISCSVCGEPAELATGHKWLMANQYHRIGNSTVHALCLSPAAIYDKVKVEKLTRHGPGDHNIKVEIDLPADIVTDREIVRMMQGMFSVQIHGWYFSLYFPEEDFTARKLAGENLGMFTTVENYVQWMIQQTVVHYISRRSDYASGIMIKDEYGRMCFQSLNEKYHWHDNLTFVQKKEFFRAGKFY